MRQPWPHHKRKQLKQKKKASTPPALPPTAEYSENDIANAGDFKGSFLPSAFNDSTRSEDSLFYTPFDEDDVAARSPLRQQQQQQDSTSTSTSTTQSLVASSQEKQRQRNEAIALLGGFFMGETAVELPPADSSPTSVMMFEEEQTTSLSSSSRSSSPRSSEKKQKQKHMISHVMDALFFGSSNKNKNSAPTEPEEEEAGAAPRHQFVKLTKNDRANSMPVQSTYYRSSSPKLSKPPSLKKISSIGKFPTSVSSNSLKRSVSFGKLGMRQYSVEISDHPSCSYGPPVQLSWDYKEKEDVCLESYEETRKPRRENHELVLSYYDRRFMLLKQAGYSKSQLKETIKEVERVKRERMVTDILLPASPVEETIVSVVDTVKGFFQKQGVV